MADRSDSTALAFAKCVTQAFSFLEERFGFSLVSAQATFVRYVSTQVFVNVYQGKKSYELNVEVGSLDSLGRELQQFSLREIVSYYRGDDGPGTHYQASDIESVRQIVPQLANLLITYGEPLLHGDPEAFARLGQFQRQKSNE